MCVFSHLFFADMFFHQEAPPYSFTTQVCMLAVDDCMVANGCAMVGSECWQRKGGFLADTSTMGPYVPVELKRGDMLIYGVSFLHPRHSVIHVPGCHAEHRTCPEDDT
jgi:ectoine hydroxylase-related dioxygenase (phytanoyl-CoA dioxygenase family)